MSKKYSRHIATVMLICSVLTVVFTGCGNQNTKDEKSVQSAQSTQSVQSESGQTQENDTLIETYFTRKDGNLDQILIGKINEAQTKLDVAIYCFTRTNIADAIVAAANRGVTVRVMTDSSEAKTKYEKLVLDKLSAAQIPVKVNTHTGIMHLKVTIVDDTAAMCGSYNYTDGATEDNDENLVVIHQKSVISQYAQEFDSMWNNTHNYKELTK